MKKSEVEQYYDRGISYPSINVKARNFGQGLELSEQAYEYAFEMACQEFWEGAEELANEIFGKVKVYSAGRSGGHLIVDDLPSIEEWDAPMLSKWAKFQRGIMENLKAFTDADYIRDMVKSNRWDEDGAEKFNFQEKNDGSSVCIVDLKRDAIKAGFGAVVRK